MKAASLPPGKEAGAVGYPLLMSAFAGIELLGALLSLSQFNKDEGAQYFVSFWRDYLYPNDSCRAAAGETLYKLVRHGLAHVYVTKGDIWVFKHAPAMHLVRQHDGAICVDAAQLAEDLEEAYESRVKPLIAAADGISSASMTMRLGEMEVAYRAQAAPLLQKLQLPLASRVITNTASGSAI